MMRVRKVTKLTFCSHCAREADRAAREMLEKDPNNGFWQALFKETGQLVKKADRLDRAKEAAGLQVNKG